MATEQWSDDECILALHTYLKISDENGRFNPKDPRIQELSMELTRMGVPRSIGSVKLRLANFQAVDPRYPGEGKGNYGMNVVRVWEKYHDSPALLEEKVKEIRRNL